MDLRIKNLEAELQRVKQKAEARGRELLNEKTALLQQNRELLDEKNALLQQNQALRQQPLQAPMNSTPQEMLAPSDLVQRLGMAAAGDKSDIDYFLQPSRAFDTSKTLLKAGRQAARSVSWLASPASDMLFIDVVGARPKASPGSFVTASLAQQAKEHDSAVVLTYFCAQHIEENTYDRMSNVFASFICQVLNAHPFDLTCWRDHRDYPSLICHVQLATERNLQYLCELFKFLLSSVQGKVVYIFIDDLFVLERNAEDESLSSMSKTLQFIMECCVGVKILCMTPDSRRQGYLVSRAESSDILEYSMEDHERGRIPAQHTRRHMGAAPLSAFVSD